MLKKLTYILSALGIISAFYGLTTGVSFGSLSVMLFFLSLLSLVRGIESFQKSDKSNGWLNIAVFSFLLFVAIQTFLVH